MATGEGDRARLLAGLALTERRVDQAGISTAVLEAGSGPPLLLLHGGIEVGGAYWAPVVGRLAEHHRVIAPDVPGLGESEPVARLDAAAFDGWLAAIVSEICQEPPLLIAHSLIGSFAARFAARRGELLARLVVYGAPGIGRYRMPLGLRAAAIRFAIHPNGGNAERLERWAFRDLDEAVRGNPEWMAAFAAYLRERATVGHVKRTMRQLVAAGTKRIDDGVLRNIPLPVGLVWGRHDRFVPLALAEQASTRLNWPLEVIDEAGHVPHIERPGAFLRALDTVAARRVRHPRG